MVILTAVALQTARATKATEENGGKLRRVLKDLRGASDISLVLNA